MENYAPSFVFSLVMLCAWNMINKCSQIYPVADCGRLFTLRVPYSPPRILPK